MSQSAGPTEEKEGDIVTRMQAHAYIDLGVVAGYIRQNGVENRLSDQICTSVGGWTSFLIEPDYIHASHVYSE